jgi:hypothetical protein
VRENVTWEELFKAAMIELDRARLQQRIADARAALRSRLEELQMSNDVDRLRERHDITDALQSLQVLERTELRLPMPIKSDTGSTSPAGGAS